MIFNQIGSLARHLNLGDREVDCSARTDFLYCVPAQGLQHVLEALYQRFWPKSRPLRRFFVPGVCVSVAPRWRTLNVDAPSLREAGTMALNKLLVAAKENFHRHIKILFYMNFYDLLFYLRQLTKAYIHAGRVFSRKLNNSLLTSGLHIQLS